LVKFTGFQLGLDVHVRGAFDAAPTLPLARSRKLLAVCVPAGMVHPARAPSIVGTSIEKTPSAAVVIGSAHDN